ncbi:ABC transporter permease DevC [Sporomusa aerivorans]|uniref:ABC transporter permease DevC n=1 Tax=Sporomusa aerivorans TaxID=204936 RepID=UPI00352BB8D9
MMLSRQFYFATHLAWRQLTHGRAKLAAATLGVMFACVLVFMQLGFMDSLNESSTIIAKRFRGELFLVHKQSQALSATAAFPRTELQRVLASPYVDSVVPVYIGEAQFKNPETKVNRTLMVWGSEPTETVLSLTDIEQFRAALTRRDTAVFDESSRPEFGDIAVLLKQGPVVTEINDRKMEVIGTVRIGTSFAADGNLITSDQNFFRIFPSRHPSQIDVGVIRVKANTNIGQLQQDLRLLLSDNVHVFTDKEFIDFEYQYWQSSAPLGFIFGFGTIMGLVVGLVIVYQILFTDITNHLKEFATLKAMGYSNRYLLLVVFSSSLILAILGFIPGFLLSLGLYNVAESFTFIPMPMPLTKVINVFLMILVMCVFAGAIAMQKMRSANPADMF